MATQAAADGRAALQSSQQQATGQIQELQQKYEQLKRHIHEAEQALRFRNEEHDQVLTLVKTEQGRTAALKQQVAGCGEYMKLASWHVD